MQLVAGGVGTKNFASRTLISSSFKAHSTSSTLTLSASSSTSWRLNFLRLLTAVFLVVSCITMSDVEGSPVRHRRETVSNIVDMDRLRNPCAIVTGAASTGTPTDCSQGDPVRLTAELAKKALAELQRQMGANTCSGMTLDARVKMPEITEAMSNEDKLREIYKSLVQHFAFMLALSSRNTNTSLSFESSLGKLQTLQCSMLCHVGLTSTQLGEVITSAGSIEVDTNQGESGQILRNCLVVDSALHLLDILLDVAQG